MRLISSQCINIALQYVSKLLHQDAFLAKRSTYHESYYWLLFNWEEKEKYLMQKMINEKFTHISLIKELLLSASNYLIIGEWIQINIFLSYYVLFANVRNKTSRGRSMHLEISCLRLAVLISMSRVIGETPRLLSRQRETIWDIPPDGEISHTIRYLHTISWYKSPSL